MFNGLNRVDRWVAESVDFLLASVIKVIENNLGVSDTIYMT